MNPKNPAEDPIAARGRSLPVSVIVLTKNEEKNIESCLRSLGRFDQIIVVDSHSTDRTCEMAIRLGAEVVPFAWNGHYPKKKQWALQLASLKHDWVLYVDADEQVPESLVEEISSMLGGRYAGFFVEYDYVFLGRTLQHGARTKKLVLFKAQHGRFVEQDDLSASNMWEVEGHYQPLVDGRLGQLRARMIHFDHDSLFHWFERHNRYSDWEAIFREKRAFSGESQPGPRAQLKRMFDTLPAKGLIAFIHSYLLRLGFLDGWPGFHYAMARGMYYWQIGAKQYERKLRRRRREGL